MNGSRQEKERFVPDKAVFDTHKSLQKVVVNSTRGQQLGQPPQPTILMRTCDPGRPNDPPSTVPHAPAARPGDDPVVLVSPPSRRHVTHEFSRIVESSSTSVPDLVGVSYDPRLSKSNTITDY